MGRGGGEVPRARENRQTDRRVGDTNTHTVTHTESERDREKEYGNDESSRKI